MEIWKKFIKNYYVSNYGNVKNINTNRILKPRKQHNGYLVVNLSICGKIKTYTIHRLVAKLFIPNPQNLPQVNHIDLNRENNYVENLEWCSASYNVVHAFKSGNRHKSEGLEHYGHKLTYSDIQTLRQDYEPFSKIPNITKVAKQYNVSRQTIHNVVNYNTYKNI